MGEEMTKQIQLKKGTLRYFYRIVASNGNILVTSQKYWSKGTAKRAAKQLAKDMKIKFVE